MKQPGYMFCTKQFKPFIILVVAIAVAVVGWTAYREGGSNGPSQSRAMGAGVLMRTATAPTIRAGTPAPHPDWGSCTMCHNVVGTQAKQAAAVMAVATAPPIRAGQPATHPDWGSCAKCHKIIGGAGVTAGKNPGRQAALLSSSAPPLGIWLRPLTPATADRLGLENADGVLITGVYDPSPGKAAGLQIGDVIRRIDGRKPESLSEALALIAQINPGDTVRLQIMRDGRARKIFVSVDENTRPVAAAGRLVAAANIPGKVAVAATSGDQNAQVAPRFGQAPVFIIWDPARRSFTSVENQGRGQLTAGAIAARQLIGEQVEGVIVGNMGPGSMLGLRASGVKVYTGAFGSIREVVAKYQQGKLIPAGATSIPNNPVGVTPEANAADKIAVASLGPNLDSLVAPELASAPYLIIYDQANGFARVVANEIEPGGGAVHTAHLLVERGASGVIAGNISPATAQSLTSLGVFSFSGVQGRVSEAIGMYRQGSLQATTLPSNNPAAAGAGVAL